MSDEAITPELLLQAYTAGYFPMARSRKGRNLYWFNPETRGVLTLDDDSFHLPRSLQKAIRRSPYTLSVDTAFADVITTCADNRRTGRDDSWINAEIIRLYTALHHMGYAHSVEVWEEHNTKQILVAGLYGVSIGGAFFGESMFSLRRDTSKMALVHLVQRLKAAGYTLLDAQFENDHLTQFGFRPMAQADYLARLESALSISPNPSSRFCSVSVSRL